MLSFCITQLGTTRFIDTVGDTQLDSHNWTHRFRNTFRHTLLRNRDMSMTEIVTYTSLNIQKTYSMNTN